MKLDSNAEFCLRVAAKYSELAGVLSPAIIGDICSLLLASNEENALLRTAAANLIGTLSLSHSARYAYGVPGDVYSAAIALGAVLNAEHLCTADCLPDAHIATNWSQKVSPYTVEWGGNRLRWRTCRLNGVPAKFFTEADAKQYVEPLLQVPEYRAFRILYLGSPIAFTDSGTWEELKE